MSAIRFNLSDYATLKDLRDQKPNNIDASKVYSLYKEFSADNKKFICLMNGKCLGTAMSYHVSADELYMIPRVCDVYSDVVCYPRYVILLEDAFQKDRSTAELYTGNADGKDDEMYQLFPTVDDAIEEYNELLKHEKFTTSYIQHHVFSTENDACSIVRYIPLKSCNFP